MGMLANKFIQVVYIGASLALSLVAVPSRLSGATIDVAEIRSALICQSLDVSTVKIISAEGIVILRGTVDNINTYEALEPAVKRLGYARVANLIRLTTAPDNSALRRAVERELSLTRALDGCQLQVTAEGGRVVIRGTVQTALQIDAATAVARGVRGVHHVETQLKNL